MVSGSGPQVRTGLEEGRPGIRPFDLLAAALARGGVASLRCDDRGVGASTGDFDTARHTDLVQDALAQVRYLQGHAGIDPRAVGILGHSDGASVAARAAAADGSVAFVIGLAAPAMPGLELMRQQLAVIVRTDAAAGAAAEAALEYEAVRLAVAADWAGLRSHLERVYAEQLRAMDQDHPLPSERVDELARAAARDAVARTYRDPWFLEFLRRDPSADWRRVRVPVLALYGEKDDVVSPGGNAAQLAELLASSGDGDVTVDTVPGANHLFQPAAEADPAAFAALPASFVPGVSERVVEWVARRFGGPAGPKDEVLPAP
jgi:hypothetical protein